MQITHVLPSVTMFPLRLAADASLPPEAHNICVMTTGNPSVKDGTLQVQIDTVPLTDDTDSGDRVTFAYAPGWHLIGMRSTVFAASAEERAAAHALDQAIAGSGLVQLVKPSVDHQQGDVGYTRIFLDRRSMFIEFRTGHAPAAAKAVLAALKQYQTVAAAR
jgi:hypothetical protein